MAQEVTFAKSLPSICLADEESGIPFYTLFVSKEQVCFFVSTCMEVISKTRSEIRLSTIEKGKIYFFSSLTRDRVGYSSTPSAETMKKFTERHEFICGNPETYLEVILPALILGCRVRDFELRCAIVTQLGGLELNIPPQSSRLRTITLKTASGQTFDIDFSDVGIDVENKRWIVKCKEPTIPLPSDVSEGCLLEIVNGASKQSAMTSALFHFHAKRKEPVLEGLGNCRVLSSIYGTPGQHMPPALPKSLYLIRLEKGDIMKLNHEQSEAVARYNSPCPAFIIEAPPGSGKTLTCASLAALYTGKGVQLFLSTTNVAVKNMASALANLDFGSRRVIHLISSEYEEKLSEDDHSPFSSLSLAKDKIQGGGHVPEIIFGTVDTILRRVVKPNLGGSHEEDPLKLLLLTRVERVVIDEASQLTEAAFNALVLWFLQAQFALVGDSKQLPPFKFKAGDVVSHLSARSTLEIAKEKKNLPVINLIHVYRAAPSLISHYSEVFYNGSLESSKPESKWNPLNCFGARGGESRLLFWKINKGSSKREGTSKINYREVNALKYIIGVLATSGICKGDLLIISYYEAQRRLAEKNLKCEYDVLTVDSAQGRESRIVIVLTTRSSIPSNPDEDFFNSPNRLNVAVSRHTEALIILGHPSIESAPNWAEVLSKRFFYHVEDDSGTGGQLWPM